ncbi:MAG: hypothetical protein NTX05_06125 [Fusobacteria bacterium]|nr:hypothetical protein [Fusobacteriota bacterium]
MKKIPLGSGGLALTFPIITQAYLYANFKIISSVLFSIGIIIFIITIINWIINMKEIMITFKEPERGGFIPTIAMALIIASSIEYHFYNGNFALCYTLFWIGVFLFVVLSIIFWVVQLRSFSISKAFPSWYIPSVGIMVVAIAGYNFRIHIFVFLITYVGYILFFAVTFVLIKRFLMKGFKFDSIKHSFGVCAAPASLIVLASGRYEIFYPVMYVFLVISLIMVIWVYTKIPYILKSAFHPSCASITFPLAVSCVAIQQVLKHIHSFEIKTILFGIMGIEIAVASMILLYVLGGYIHWVFKKNYQ